MLHAFVVIILLLAHAPSWAAEVQSVDAGEENGRYIASFDAVIDAPMDRTLHLMLTPGLWPRLSPIIVDAEVLEKAENGPGKVRIKFYDCIFIFCKTFQKIEDVSIAADGHVTSLAIPDQSDFDYAREDWQVFAEGGRTHIRYKTEMVPNFFVPPLIGPYVIKSHIRTELVHIVTNLEEIALHEDRPPP